MVERVTTIECDLCGNSEHSLMFVGRDYRFGLTGRYSFVECDECGLIYLNPRPSDEAIMQLYEENYTRESKAATLPEQGISRWRTLRKYWHKLNGNYGDALIANAKGRVLDIGCGNGKFLLPLQRAGCEVYGVETNRRYVELHKQLGLNVLCGTLEDAKFRDNFFDTVIMSQVVEHLVSPKQCLREIQRILKPAGIVLIYCPNANGYLRRCFGKYWHGWHIPFHFYVFSRITLSRLAEQAGLKVRSIGGVTPDDFFTTSLKSYFFGGGDAARPIDRGRFFESLIFRGSVAPLFRLLDCILKGKEDCLQVELSKP